MYGADNRLTLAASGLFRLMQQEEFAWEEMHAFHAPGECWPIIQKGLDQDRTDVLKEFGFTEETFEEAFYSRVRRSAHMHFLLGALIH